jgi:hypothetical protein
MILEAFRVLKPKSRACFTVWGTKKKSVFCTIENIAKKNLGIATPQNYLCNIELGDDILRIKEVMLKTGFNEVKYWHQQTNFPIRTGEDFVNLKPISHTESLNANDVIKLRNEMIRLYNELSGTKTHDFCNFESTVILAFKD